MGAPPRPIKAGERTLWCNICLRQDTPAEQGDVRSNVRRFRDERFALWRCAHCGSLHARHGVDLDLYYADYPFHRGDQLDWLLRAMYRNLEGRLRKVGVEPTASILDYGCGNGLFLRFLEERGYTDVNGYDAYSRGHADEGVLDRAYDCVVTQDVIEHVPDPLELVQTLHDLTRPGGLVAVGTPNADALDLADPETCVHTFHQPYHRHILSSRALRKLGSELGWELVAFWPTSYTNTRVPFVNSVFLRHYLASSDDTVDVAFDPLGPWAWRLATPAGLARGLFGSWWAPDVDVMAVFRLR